jgi:transcriptional regulator with XRE-family HTH domain
VARAEQDRIRLVIAETRERAGVSQRELSRRLGESAPYMWSIERGERTVDLVEFMDIAKALGVDVIEIFAKIVGP